MKALALAATLAIASTPALACGARITDQYGGRMLQSDCGGFKQLSPDYVTGGGTSIGGTRYTPQPGGGLLVQRKGGGTEYAPPDYATGGFTLFADPSTK
jgi:hypothetical protein